MDHYGWVTEHYRNHMGGIVKFQDARRKADALKTAAAAADASTGVRDPHDRGV